MGARATGVMVVVVVVATAAAAMVSAPERRGLPLAGLGGGAERAALGDRRATRVGQRQRAIEIWDRETVAYL